MFSLSSITFNKYTNGRKEHGISDLLGEYPALVKRDNYSAHWREATLRRPGARSYRLDFGLKTNFSQVYDMSVLEFKVPNDRLIVSPDFHPTFSSRVIRGLTHSNNYRRYIHDEKNRGEMQRVFGFIPEKVECNIIVGRLEEKERHLETFNQRNQEFNAVGTNITTYDEFIQTSINYLSRRELLSILS